MEEVGTDEAKYQKLRQSLLGYELIVDSAEQPVQRPVDYQQKKYYSGKKMHTFKNQFIVLPNGEDIVDVIVGKLGKTSDINLFRLAVISWPQTKVLGDKAYKMRQLQRLTKKLRKPKLPNSKTRKTKIVFSKNRCWTPDRSN